MKKATIIMVVVGMALSGMQQAYGNWLTNLVDSIRGRTHQTSSDPDKGDVRRTR